MGKTRISARTCVYPLIVLRADPISTCKGLSRERWVELENPTKRAQKISDRRVGRLVISARQSNRRRGCKARPAAAATYPRTDARSGSRKNDKVFSFLRKRKNFEIFSTCSDGGDIEAGDGACRERGMAGRPGGKSRKNDKVSSSLRERKNFDTFSTCSDRGGCRGAWSAVHASPMQQGAAGRRLSRLPLAVHGLIL